MASQGVKFTGDFDALRRLGRGFRKIADQAETRRVNRILSEEALHQLQEGFERGVDPYDHPWRPPKYRNGQPLRDTGRLMASYHSFSTDSGFGVATDVKYAVYLQNGTRVMVRRAQVPWGHRKLGRRWREAFELIIQRERMLVLQGAL